jgi:hypothetical protein
VGRRRWLVGSLMRVSCREARVRSYSIRPRTEGEATLKEAANKPDELNAPRALGVSVPSSLRLTAVEGRNGSTARGVAACEN